MAMTSEEWEPGIPIWCEACQLRLNGPGQLQDHVEGDKHKQRKNKPAPKKKEPALTFKGSREDLQRTICHLQVIVMDLEDNIAGNPDPEWIHPGGKLDGTHPAPMCPCCKKMYTCDCDGNGHPTPPLSSRCLHCLFTQNEGLSLLRTKTSKELEVPR